MTTTTVGATDLMAVLTAHQDSGEPAIIHNGQAIGYADLVGRIRAVARSLGPEPGTVAVYATRTPETVSALLGVLAAGGAYCPIDPGFPAERRTAMLRAADCRALLTTADDQPFAAGLRTVDSAHLSPGCGTIAHADPADPAYVLFTSGSTGAPKPVVTPRRAISTTVSALRELFGLTPADRVLQFASLNWDTCFEEILPTLTAGAALIVDDEAHTGSFPRFLRMVAERGVTVLDLPTAYWHELVRHLAEDGTSLPGCVRLVIIGGEAASPARLADWHALDTDGVRLLNTYGCTETTLITHATGLDVPVTDGRIPIGRALPHVRELIDDGELLVGGPAIALGYLGLPAATDARFVELADGRYFRTGDRVARTDDGLLLHLGRVDGEVKVRGIRVDPGEVEALIGAHPDVAAVAVVGATVSGRTMLAGYLVPGTGAERIDLAAEVLAWLRARTPGHLVPGRLNVVRELAYTASGKVDRAETHRRNAPARAGRRDDER